MEPSNIQHPEKYQGNLAPNVAASIKKQTGRGRPNSRETKLGRLLSDRDLNVSSVGVFANVSPRYMTEYCAGRKELTQVHILSLCRVLDVTPDMIMEDVEDEYQDEITELTDSSTSIGGLRKTKTVKDLQREQKARLEIVKDDDDKE